MTAWEWFLIVGSIAPGPIWWGWRWYRVRRQIAEGARLRADIMAARRERFAGVVRVPGSKAEIRFIDKDDK